ncbi:hypothetical protein [Shewanella aquimarina]|uniref:hypothetical protein n=1 Tax=Shewanella aquimarina TaxID=260365 RepID=UPI0020148423|nr:hypothetical protein [Shewanella aquimarina]MCL2910046.1 hypothetical protein [Shewanella aquimarina]
MNKVVIFTLQKKYLLKNRKLNQQKTTIKSTQNHIDTNEKTFTAIQNSLLKNANCIFKKSKKTNHITNKRYYNSWQLFYLNIFITIYKPQRRGKKQAPNYVGID